MEFQIVDRYEPGCIGRVAELHARHYAAAAGFGAWFEAKVATELSEFVSRFDGSRDGLWLAKLGPEIHGSIAVSGPRAPAEAAHLRWFITSEALRGRGAGTRLLAEALAFCDGKGYGSTFLWTFQGLEAARHLYEKQGFALESQQPGSRWGSPVLEQRFVRPRRRE
jgi:GNAT superfamily N-acetyltransferase